MFKLNLAIIVLALAVACRAQDSGKVIAPDGQEGVLVNAGDLSERTWGHWGYSRYYYNYPYYSSYYYYPYYGGWYYRDGTPVPADQAPAAPSADGKVPEKVKRAADEAKVVAPDGEDAEPAAPGLLSERTWGYYGWGYPRYQYYYYPSYGYGGYYYPYYNRWYYRDGTPVPEDKAPPAPTSEPEAAPAKVKRAAEDKVIAPGGEEAVKAQPGTLDERTWGYYGWNYYPRHHYYYYPSYGYGGYYYPYYNRWYYRDGTPVPEDKAPPAPTSEPEAAPAKVKRAAEDKVVAPGGEEAVEIPPGQLNERTWGYYGGRGYYPRYYYNYYPSYGYGGYYYPYYNRWYYRDGSPVPADKAPPAPASQPEA